MIRLELDDYCQEDCIDFDPDCEKVRTLTWTDEDDEVVVRCENRNKCKKLFNHLRNYASKYGLGE